jgi:hypothetical protein
MESIYFWFDPRRWLMLLLSNLFLLLVNAVTFRREFTILFNRVAIFILLYSGIIGYDSLYVTYLDNGIGIYNGLFHSTAITHSFDLFTYIIAPIILLLTAFYARRIVQPIIPIIVWRITHKMDYYQPAIMGQVMLYLLPALRRDKEFLLRFFLVIGLFVGLLYLLCLEDFAVHDVSIMFFGIFPFANKKPR